MSLEIIFGMPDLANIVSSFLDGYDINQAAVELCHTVPPQTFNSLRRVSRMFLAFCNKRYFLEPSRSVGISWRPDLRPDGQIHRLQLRLLKHGFVLLPADLTIVLSCPNDHDEPDEAILRFRAEPVPTSVRNLQLSNKCVGELFREAHYLQSCKVSIRSITRQQGEGELNEGRLACQSDWHFDFQRHQRCEPHHPCFHHEDKLRKVRGGPHLCRMFSWNFQREFSAGHYCEFR